MNEQLQEQLDCKHEFDIDYEDLVYCTKCDKTWLPVEEKCEKKAGDWYGDHPCSCGALGLHACPNNKKCCPPKCVNCYCKCHKKPKNIYVKRQYYDLDEIIEQSQNNDCPNCNVSHKQGTRCLYNQKEVDERFEEVIRSCESILRSFVSKKTKGIFSDLRSKYLND